MYASVLPSSSLTNLPVGSPLRTVSSKMVYIKLGYLGRHVASYSNRWPRMQQAPGGLDAIVQDESGHVVMSLVVLRNKLQILE